MRLFCTPLPPSTLPASDSHRTSALMCSNGHDPAHCMRLSIPHATPDPANFGYTTSPIHLASPQYTPHNSREPVHLFRIFTHITPSLTALCNHSLFLIILQLFLRHNFSPRTTAGAHTPVPISGILRVVCASPACELDDVLCRLVRHTRFSTFCAGCEFRLWPSCPVHLSDACTSCSYEVDFRWSSFRYIYIMTSQIYNYYL